MSMDEKVLVLLATYNELENLPKLVEGIAQSAPHAEILVIDDNSPDGTGDWCDKQAATNPKFHCIHREGKLGLGTAILTGMKYAVEHDYDYLLNLDADFSHHPKYIPDLLEGMDAEVDVRIGSRYVRGGGIEGWPWKRHIMSRGVNFLARWLLGLSVRDCSGAFRCYRVSKLAELDFDSIHATGYAFLEEVLWHLKCQGCRFDETPIVFVDRIHGQSKINSKEAWKALGVLFSLGFRNYCGQRNKPTKLTTH